MLAPNQGSLYSQRALSVRPNCPSKLFQRSPTGSYFAGPNLWHLLALWLLGSFSFSFFLIIHPLWLFHWRIAVSEFENIFLVSLGTEQQALLRHGFWVKNFAYCLNCGYLMSPSESDSGERQCALKLSSPSILLLTSRKLKSKDDPG